MPFSKGTSKPEQCKYREHELYPTNVLKGFASSYSWDLFLGTQTSTCIAYGTEMNNILFFRSLYGYLLGHM